MQQAPVAPVLAERGSPPTGCNSGFPRRHLRLGQMLCLWGVLFCMAWLWMARLGWRRC